MIRGVIIFFLATSFLFAGDTGHWAPFPLDNTNNIYDKRIVSNLVYAINERCSVVTGVPPIDASTLTNFVTRDVLKIIDDKIDQLIPLFIDRSFTNQINGDLVFNGWFRKYNLNLDIYNFDLGNGVTQLLPRLNMPQAFRQANVGTNIWPIYSWQDQITNFPPLQTTEDRITTFLVRPEYTLVPQKPIVSTIAEWRYVRVITGPTNAPLTNDFWMDSRLNTIPSNTLNYTNYLGSALPSRPFPYQGRLYDNTKLPYMQWFSTNSLSPGIAGSVRGIAYDDTGDLYRQNILTNDGLTVFEVIWPPQNGVAVQMTNLFLQITNSVSAWPSPAIPEGLPQAGIGGALPQIGDVIRIWYELEAIETFSGVEPYTGIDRDYANILWKECLNERYRIINAMRWTTAKNSGGDFGWACSTSYVYECDMSDEWPPIEAQFPIGLFVSGTNLSCPPPVTPYTPPQYGIFPGWIERTGSVYSITNDCGQPENVGSNQYPQAVYSINGSNEYSSSINIISGIPLEFDTPDDLEVLWYIDRVDTGISGDATASVQFAVSAPFAYITNSISNLSYAVDFYLFGSNSILSGIDNPEWIPLKTQTVSMAANTWAATGTAIEASAVPFTWQFPAQATSSVTAGPCPASAIEDYRTNFTTAIVVSAASYLCDTQQAQVTNFSFEGWEYKSNLVNDVLDYGRTNRFETRYFWVLYSPTSSWETTTNAEACYWRVLDYNWTQQPVSCNKIISDDPMPDFSDILIETVSSNGLEPWDDLALIVGFYPTGETRIIDGYTNNAGEPQGDLYLTVSSYDPVSGQLISYSNDTIYSYFWQTPVYSNKTPELYYQHSQTNECAYDPLTATSRVTWTVLKGEYSSSVAFSNSVTNAWIMQWEPVIRWDVVGGFKYVD